MLGEYELADSWIREIEKLAPETTLFAQALLATMRGEPERAVRLYTETASRDEDPGDYRFLGLFSLSPLNRIDHRGFLIPAKQATSQRTTTPIRQGLSGC